VLGPLAYAVSALQNLSSPHPSRYHLTLDGQQVEVEGLVCTIANSANTGMGGISLVPKIDLADGLFDVVVVRRADLAEIAAILAQNLAPEAAVEPLPHWHAREVTVEADPPQTVVLDGEEIGQTPVSAQVIPSAARIVVPGA
jgi:diacylglycerol kinase (ATP)